MDTKKAPRTLLEAVRHFADPTVCREALVAARWPRGVRCPHCKSKEVTWLANAGLWKCRTKHARQKFSVKVGTIFEDSPIGLDKWLPVVWMLVNCKNGISSLEVMRDLGVTQKTAWFMLHRVRLALREGSLTKLGGGGGVVEVDESWIGGAARSMNTKQRKKVATGFAKRGPRKNVSYTVSGKAIVLGMLERGGHGRVRLRHVPDVSRETLEPHIREHVADGSDIHTDAHGGYSRLDWPDFTSPIHEQYYNHQVVDHAVQYVRGNVHTNSLENFWSLLKRGIRGTYVSVEPFHLHRYLDEQAFRFNDRTPLSWPVKLCSTARCSSYNAPYVPVPPEGRRKIGLCAF